jgi:hypothetical protein
MVARDEELLPWQGVQEVEASWSEKVFVPQAVQGEPELTTSEKKPREQGRQRVGETATSKG